MGKKLTEILISYVQDFSKRKKKGKQSLIYLICEWGIENNVNLNWLLTGEGSPYLENDPESVEKPQSCSELSSIVTEVKKMKDRLDKLEGKIDPKKPTDAGDLKGAKVR